MQKITFALVFFYKVKTKPMKEKETDDAYLNPKNPVLERLDGYIKRTREMLLHASKKADKRPSQLLESPSFVLKVKNRKQKHSYTASKSEEIKKDQIEYYSPKKFQEWTKYNLQKNKIASIYNKSSKNTLYKSGMF